MTPQLTLMLSGLILLALCAGGDWLAQHKPPDYLTGGFAASALSIALLLCGLAQHFYPDRHAFSLQIILFTTVVCVFLLLVPVAILSGLRKTRTSTAFRIAIAWIATVVVIGCSSLFLVLYVGCFLTGECL